jgi:ornithine--oxo-acid transaminase
MNKFKSLKLEGFDNVEFGNIEAVKNAINKNTAGILIEPIQGEEGIRVSNKNFIKDLRYYIILISR